MDYSRDGDFLELMIDHHCGGVDMADAILERTDRLAVREFASAMSRSQSSEIETMQAMLADITAPG